MNPRLFRSLPNVSGLVICALALVNALPAQAADDRVRMIVETDAGGDPDDEQSLVRLLVYANEFDIEGIIANRPKARDGENKNPVRDGLGIVQAMVRAYGECYSNLKKHAPNYPTPEELLARTVAGYNDVENGVELVIRAVDSPDPRPVWFCNWGTDEESAESCLKRALDLVLRERGKEGYAKFKSRVHLSSADKFGDHTAKIDPPFPFWLNASHPTIDGKRWYHRFSPLTARAGGFDIERDVRKAHGPLGALYPTNTTHPQKEGDTMMFLYLIRTGMNDPAQPTWGSWAGRHGRDNQYGGKPYFWANVQDAWQGKTNRDNTLLRWAEAMQNDFAARMDWCVADAFSKANHPPQTVLNDDATKTVVQIDVKSGDTVRLKANGTKDPDGNKVAVKWFIYPEAGTFRGEAKLDRDEGAETAFVAPRVEKPESIHVIMEARDDGKPNLLAHRRAVVNVRP